MKVFELLFENKHLKNGQIEQFAWNRYRSSLKQRIGERYRWCL